MSAYQIGAILTFWILAAIPLAVTFVIFIVTRSGMLATPIPDHYHGAIAKIATLLTIGGWVGLRSIIPGFGVACALAGVWFGILKMANADKGFWEVTTLNWGDLLFIVLSGPAVAAILCSAIIIYFGLTNPAHEAARKAN